MTAQKSGDESLLLVQIAQKDQTALAKLYDRYGRASYALAYKILGSVEEAEEVVLDVFSQIWQKAASYDVSRSRVDTWLFMLTRSRSLDRLRVLQRSFRAAVASLEDAKIAKSGIAEPMENAILEELSEQVKAALEKLPAEQRQAIELAYYQGLTCAAIATKTGIPMGTIKTRIRLGISKLRQALSEIV
ncbi:MAG: sigma-70 family RNA polymerase sigma factor [Tychonema bourrellyi B0820]|uniref:RNA polymerase subunit sigma-24 n=1 Tax=Tychonema bourrellyi FEM_GT703 TaxID=2040638 RepID=A0A2G4F5R2_9CYAN|nr:sigma-70 family RNA polymerase sigma factor [Tychonema bourrellyi]MDQ2097834.1 sigma-70 family RNA polymerase sigma factor [Tychonema bourrellyi B0820]PHX57078.1 RNA polymerase subunit sigma-24 [Tychonema bourrellyi FEM_GT703]